LIGEGKNVDPFLDASIVTNNLRIKSINIFLFNSFISLHNNSFIVFSNYFFPNELKRKIFLLFILKLFVTVSVGASRKGSMFFPSPIKQ